MYQDNLHITSLKSYSSDLFQTLNASSIIWPGHEWWCSVDG